MWKCGKLSYLLGHRVQNGLDGLGVEHWHFFKARVTSSFHRIIDGTALKKAAGTPCFLPSLGVGFVVSKRKKKKTSSLSHFSADNMHGMKEREKHIDLSGRREEGPCCCCCCCCCFRGVPKLLACSPLLLPPPLILRPWTNSVMVLFGRV